MPPRPHLFGHIGQEGGEELEVGGEGRLQGVAGRLARRSAPAAVGPVLHQLQIIVGERPERSLGALQGSGVVALVEGGGGVVDQVSQTGEQCPIEGLSGLGVGGRFLAKHEAAGVEDLHRQATAHPHLALLEGGVGAGPPRRRPVAEGVGAEGLQGIHGGDHVALGLGHLLAVGVEHPARDSCGGPRQPAVFEVGPGYGGEQPGADDLVGLGAQVHGEGAFEQVGVVFPVAGDLGAQRGGGPGVHHIGVGSEPAGLVPLVLGVAGGCFGGGVHREAGLVGRDGVVIVGLAAGVERVPDGKGHAEEALAADEPVAVEAADPVLIADPHVLGDPVELPAPFDEGVAQGRIAPAVADVPLAGGDDLQRALALLEELHRMGDGPGLSDQLARLLEQLDRALLGAVDGAPGDLGVGGGVDPLWRVGHDAAAPVDNGPHRQVQLPPPSHVGGVAEGADHGRAGPLFGIGQGVGHHGHRRLEQRCGDGLAEQLLVALVVGVGHHGHAGGEQLGAGGVDEQVGTVGKVEGQAVVGAGTLPVFQLGLGHRSAEGHVPQAGGLALVGLAPGQVAEEGPLGGPAAALVDGGVGEAPVDGQPKAAPQLLEGLLVGGGELHAQLHEVVPGDGELVLAGFVGGLEVGVVGEGGVAADAEVVLYPALGGQAVVVPAHGVIHLLASHAVESGEGVGVGVAEDVADVEGAADGGGWGVDGVHLVAEGGAVEAVRAVGLPDFVPFGF